jgi:hypothetical protein
MSKAFKFYTDPGHGWLKVTRADCLDLGFTANDFSAYSYLGDGGEIYLEEDCDAPKFLHAYQAKHGAMPTIKESHCSTSSRIRRMRRNEPT